MDQKTSKIFKAIGTYTLYCTVGILGGMLALSSVFPLGIIVGLIAGAVVAGEELGENASKGKIHI
jgi:hypothetical protein